MKKMKALCIIACLFCLFLVASGYAAETTPDGERGDVTDTTYQITNADLYVEPSVDLNDLNNTNMYYVYEADTLKIFSGYQVEYQGAEYTCIAIGAPTLDDLKINGKSIFAADTTIFFAPGNYTDNLSYTAFNFRNLTLVGLETLSDGTPSATISRIPISQNHPEKLERKILSAENIHLENLVFSGSGYDMAYNKEGNAGSSRGEYFFVVGSGAKNFLMRDVIIENVGASTEGKVFFPKKNVAINVLYACAEQGSGQKNFENVIIRNNKTMAGYGTLSTNQSDMCYFKNLTVDNAQASAISYSVKIEHSSTAQQTDVTKNAVCFSGTTTLSDGMIYIQDYRYATVSMPYTEGEKGYRYVMYRTSNGSTNSVAMMLCDFLPEYQVNSYNTFAILDRADNYWVVREDNATSVNDQLTYIQKVEATLSSLYTGSDRNIPPVNIKLIAGETVDGFILPDFGENTPVNIVALADLEKTKDEKAPVYVSEEAVFSLGASGPWTTLFNFDFHTLAGWTYHQAVLGLDASVTPQDPCESLYATETCLAYCDYSKTADAPITGTGLCSTTFSNCVFTQLAESLSMCTVPGEVEGLSTFRVKATIDSFYCAPAGTLTQTTTDARRDTRIMYSSSDPTVATVDANTGEVTRQGSGTVTIYAKAVDFLNQGEIEKPFAAMTFTLPAEYGVDFRFISETDGYALPEEVLKLLPTDTRTYTTGTKVDALSPEETEVAVADGTWTFTGWDRTSAVMEEENLLFTGSWAFVPNTTPPEESTEAETTPEESTEAETTSVESDTEEGTTGTPSDEAPSTGSGAPMALLFAGMLCGTGLCLLSMKGRRKSH